MEIIIVSVLSTLGVVGIVMSIVVAFRKLKSKVDVNEYSRTMDHLQQRVHEISKENGQEIENVYKDCNNYIAETREKIEKRIDELSRFIDSRCDKLDMKIQEKIKK